MEHYLLASFLYGLDSARPVILPFSFTRRSFESTAVNVKLNTHEFCHPSCKAFEIVYNFFSKDLISAVYKDSGACEKNSSNMQRKVYE